MPVTIEAVGTVEAISTVEIRSQVTGLVRRILFTPGEAVRNGRLLFELDAAPFEVALTQAQAVVARDAAQADAAKTQRDRLEKLFQRGLIPRDQFDAQAASVAALDATLTADQAQVEQARLNLQYCRITAPIDGRTGALQSQVGDLVRANDTTPLVTINQLSPIYITFSVPARSLNDIRHHAARERLAVTTTGEIREHGQLSFIDNAVDPETATISLKATFENADRNLWPGLFVPVALQLASQPDAVVVPAIAVQPSQTGSYVYVVGPEATAEMRKVVVERQLGDEAVIADGLKGGEQVVTEGQLRLTPGTRVTAAGGAGAMP